MDTYIPVLALVAAVFFNAPAWALALTAVIAVTALAGESATLIKKWRAL
ncbi:hypothetical protein [Corynebacterium atypicum]|nr:hypothetical protein [Corynebacterium atypicum]